MPNGFRWVHSHQQDHSKLDEINEQAKTNKWCTFIEDLTIPIPTRLEDKLINIQFGSCKNRSNINEKKNMMIMTFFLFYDDFLYKNRIHLQL